MADFLTHSLDSWPTVRVVSQTDPVLGSNSTDYLSISASPINLQAQGLYDRTEWLNERLKRVAAATSAGDNDDGNEDAIGFIQNNAALKASATQAGIIQKADTATVKAGVSALHAPSVMALAAGWRDGITGMHFTSAYLTIPNATDTHEILHGLGRQPRYVQAYIVNTFSQPYAGMFGSAQTAVKPVLYYDVSDSNTLVSSDVIVQTTETHLYYRLRTTKLYYENFTDTDEPMLNANEQSGLRLRFYVWA